MREEIEAAALFITKLVNKNLSQSGSAVCSSASSTHSSSSSSSSSDSPPGFYEQTTVGATGSDQDKVEQFRQCLTKALYERFHNHWFPEQPTKGQAYRCIRLNEWDRHDTTLQKACSQCGIDYKDLQLPVELTLWVDPDEVTCRFGENKGSHCLVAKFKDGAITENNFNNIDISNIDIEIFRQSTTERMRQMSLHGSPDYNRQLNHQHNNFNNNNINQIGSYQFLQHNNSSNGHHHHQQAQQTPTQQQHHHHHHRSSLGKSAILPSYHHNYLNSGVSDSSGNTTFYYF